MFSVALCFGAGVFASGQAIGQGKGLYLYLVNSYRGRGHVHTYTGRRKRLFQKQSKILSERNINSHGSGSKPASPQSPQAADCPARQLLRYRLPARLRESGCVSLGCCLLLFTCGAGTGLSCAQSGWQFLKSTVTFPEKSKLLTKVKWKYMTQRIKLE